MLRRAPHRHYLLEIFDSGMTVGFQETFVMQIVRGALFLPDGMSFCNSTVGFVGTVLLLKVASVNWHFPNGLLHFQFPLFIDF